VNQAELRQLAEERITDAAALIAGGRWSYAYYTAGYAVECAVKACVLARMGQTGWIFSEPRVKVEEVFTHSYEKLIRIAGLENELHNRLKASAAAAPIGAAPAGAGPAAVAGAAAPPGPAFAGFWGVVARWDVASRYATKSETEARDLYSAITDTNDGILPWLRNYW
jgi:hypothetical protein